MKTLSLLAILFPVAAFAATPQNLSATVGGKKFESDDDGILYLMPTKSTFNLLASTRGASAYPPPKTPIDKLSVNCRNYAAKPVKWEAKDFSGSGCEVTFTVGVSPKPFGEPTALYKAVPGGKNLIEVTSVKGKVIEGRFAFEMVEAKTKAKLVITDGTFKAEDRQQ